MLEVLHTLLESVFVSTSLLLGSLWLLWQYFAVYLEEFSVLSARELNVSHLHVDDELNLELVFLVSGLFQGHWEVVASLLILSYFFSLALIFAGLYCEVRLLKSRVVIRGVFVLVAALAHLGDLEDLCGVCFLVERQFASLSESFSAARVGALVWPLTSVSVSVLFKVLSKGELLEADQANELLVWVVSDLMSSQREFGGEFFVATIEVAGKSLFAHVKFVVGRDCIYLRNVIIIID